MSSRFHNKWHRHNHHTNQSNDPRYPDSAHDPIASPDHPFQGDFVIQGMLSASGGLISTNLSATNVSFVGVSASALFSSISATGDFLLLNVKGVPRALRLWSYE
jgi:hypothetical protein